MVAVTMATAYIATPNMTCMLSILENHMLSVDDRSKFLFDFSEKKSEILMFFALIYRNSA